MGSVNNIYQRESEINEVSHGRYNNSNYKGGYNKGNNYKGKNDYYGKKDWNKNTKGSYQKKEDKKESKDDKYQKLHVLVAKLFTIFTRTCSGSYAISWLECRQTNMFDAKTVILY